MQSSFEYIKQCTEHPSAVRHLAFVLVLSSSIPEATEPGTCVMLRAVVLPPSCTCVEHVCIVILMVVCYIYKKEDVSAIILMMTEDGNNNDEVPLHDGKQEKKKINLY